MMIGEAVGGTHIYRFISQTCPLVHVPQSNCPPHPSERLPQNAPRDSHVIGVQTTELTVTRTFAVSASPSTSVTVKLTLYVPAENRWVGFWTVAFPPSLK